MKLIVKKKPAVVAEKPKAPAPEIPSKKKVLKKPASAFAKTPAAPEETKPDLRAVTSGRASLAAPNEVHRVSSAMPIAPMPSRGEEELAVECYAKGMRYAWVGTRTTEKTELRLLIGHLETFTEKNLDDCYKAAAECVRGL